MPKHPVPQEECRGSTGYYGTCSFGRRGGIPPHLHPNPFGLARKRWVAGQWAQDLRAGGAASSRENHPHTLQAPGSRAARRARGDGVTFRCRRVGFPGDRRALRAEAKEMLARRQRDPLQSLQRRNQELKQQVSSGCPLGDLGSGGGRALGRTLTLGASPIHFPFQVVTHPTPSIKLIPAPNWF